MPKFTPVITDHAMLRFLERVHGIDVHAIRRQLYDMIGEQLSTGATCWRVGDIEFRAERGTLKTVIDKSDNPRQTNNHR